MNVVLSMAMKDLKILTRDKGATFFIAVFPILMGLFFGLMSSGFSGGSSGKGKINIAIADQDQSDTSKIFVKSLESNDNLNVELVDDLESARESVRKGQRVALLVLPQGFGETAGILWQDPPEVQLGIDPSRAAEAGMLQGFVMEAMGQLVAERFQNPSQLKPFISQSRQQVLESKEISTINRQLLLAFFGSLETVFDSMEKVNSATPDSPAALANQNIQFAKVSSLDLSRKVDPNSTRGQLQKINSQWDISFPQAMLWGVLGCVAGFAISIAREDTLGTLIRLKAAPVTRFQILAGKAVACFITAILVMTSLVVLGVLLGMRPNSYPMLALAAFCVAYCFVGIMMAISVLGRTEQSVSGAGWAINMIMAMLGGCMIPVMFMPAIIQKVSVISPIMWAIRAIEGAVWREFSTVEMLFPCGVLIGFGTLGLVIGTSILMKRH